MRETHKQWLLYSKPNNTRLYSKTLNVHTGIKEFVLLILSIPIIRSLLIILPSTSLNCYSSLLNSMRNCAECVMTCGGLHHTLMVIRTGLILYVTQFRPSPLFPYSSRIIPISGLFPDSFLKNLYQFLDNVLIPASGIKLIRAGCVELSIVS